MAELKWYGYLHVNGQIHVKRYMEDPGDLEEARESDFVQFVTEPFKASTRDEAMVKAFELINKNHLSQTLTSEQNQTDPQPPRHPNDDK